VHLRAQRTAAEIAVIFSQKRWPVYNLQPPWHFSGTSLDCVMISTNKLCPYNSRTSIYH
jgi:hypothetical protein